MKMEMKMASKSKDSKDSKNSGGMKDMHKRNVMMKQEYDRQSLEAVMAGKCMPSYTDWAIMNAYVEVNEAGAEAEPDADEAGGKSDKDADDKGKY